MHRHINMGIGACIRRVMDIAQDVNAGISITIHMQMPSFRELPDFHFLDSLGFPTFLPPLSVV